MQWCGVEDYHVWSRLLMATRGIHIGMPLVFVSGTPRTMRTYRIVYSVPDGQHHTLTAVLVTMRTSAGQELCMELPGTIRPGALVLSLISVPSACRSMWAR